MTTKEKLLKAFDKFRPHINGHKTAMDLFFEGITEVENMQEELNKLRLLNSCETFVREGNEISNIKKVYTKRPSVLPSPQ